MESPSLYISNERLLKDCEDVRQWPTRVYIGIGTRETGEAEGDREAVALIRRFGERLAAAGVKDRRLLMVVDEGGTHREDAWARRLPRAVEFLYRK